MRGNDALKTTANEHLPVRPPVTSQGLAKEVRLQEHTHAEGMNANERALVAQLRVRQSLLNHRATKELYS